MEATLLNDREGQRTMLFRPGQLRRVTDPETGLALIDLLTSA